MPDAIRTIGMLRPVSCSGVHNVSLVVDALGPTLAALISTAGRQATKRRSGIIDYCPGPDG